MNATAPHADTAVQDLEHPRLPFGTIPGVLTLVASIKPNIRALFPEH